MFPYDTRTHNSQHLFYLFRRCFLCMQNTTVTSWYRKQETFCHSTSLQLLPGICNLITTEQTLPNTGENVWSVTVRCLVSSLLSGHRRYFHCRGQHGITVSYILMQGWYMFFNQASHNLLPLFLKVEMAEEIIVWCLSGCLVVMMNPLVTTVNKDVKNETKATT